MASRCVFGIVLVAAFLFNLYLVRREPPLVRIADIRPIMNFSRVRVEGVLKSNARMLRSGTVLYTISDESGTLPVFLNSAPAGKLPKAGSHMSVTGRLSIGAGNQIRMRAHDALQIVVLETAAPTLVRGHVVEVRPPPPDSNAPHKIIMARPEGPIEVIHWFKPNYQVAVGDELEAKGTIGFYNGRMQIKVQNAGDIRLQSDG